MPSQAERRRGQARAMALVCGGAALDSMKAAAGLFDHDYLLTVIYLALLEANLGGLLTGPQDLSDPDGLPLDQAVMSEESLRPVSVHALSGTLKLPYETTRRAVGRLIDQGHARRVSHSGIIVVLEQIEKSDFADVAGRLVAAARQVAWRLDREGLKVDDR